MVNELNCIFKHNKREKCNTRSLKEKKSCNLLLKQ